MAFVIAGLAPAVLMALIWHETNLSAMVFAITFLIALSHAILLGLPLFLICQLRGWINLVSCVFLGAFIGILPAGILAFPTQLFEFITGAWTNGVLASPGKVITAAIWADYIEPLIYFALLGAWGGFVFWAVLKCWGMFIGGRQDLPDNSPATSLNLLDAEVVGPRSLLPYGHKCRLHFDASGIATVTIGMKNYGRGYASPYFASLVVARLAIPATRVRLYYAGNLPAAKIGFRDLEAVPNRESVGPENAQIGDLIEGLCDAAIEKGRRYFADAIGAQASDIRFEPASGRFLGPAGRCCAHILELAKAACEGRPTLELVCRAM